MAASTKAVTQHNGMNEMDNGRRILVYTKNQVPIIVSGRFEVEWKDPSKDGIPVLEEYDSEAEAEGDDNESKDDIEWDADLDEMKLKVNHVESLSVDQSITKSNTNHLVVEENSKNVNGEVVKPVGLYSQISAVAYKNFTLSRKNKRTNCCYGCLSVCMILLTYL